MLTTLFYFVLSVLNPCLAADNPRLELVQIVPNWTRLGSHPLGKIKEGWQRNPTTGVWTIEWFIPMDGKYNLETTPGDNVGMEVTVVRAQREGVELSELIKTATRLGNLGCVSTDIGDNPVILCETREGRVAFVTGEPDDRNRYTVRWSLVQR